ncbi:GNAT family acetyltransferase [Pyrenophora tritici-repentis]|nr:GNAT family acetyltransferase [Pyrenophora tritici-repentis]KAI0605041.1 GNAT family acetyltransferase [Pyrenophora tritici-repentis]KAI0620208.1 GNAT family acetyltransferase [Pyrenophora tritici-repentis]
MAASISLRPAQPTDAPGLAAIHTSAFSTNKLMRAIYPTSQVWAAFQSAVERKMMADMHDAHTTVLVATAKRFSSGFGAEREAAQGEVEERDEIVGFAVWIHPTPCKEGFTPPAWNLPEGTDWGVLGPWKEASEKVASHVIGERPHYELSWLAVASQYARRGVGTMLLRWGLDACDREHVPAYLDSTVEAAENFYLKAGFEEKGRIKLMVKGEMYEEVACLYDPKRSN